MNLYYNNTAEAKRVNKNERHGFLMDVFFADYFFGGLNGKIKKLKRGAENEHKKE